MTQGIDSESFSKAKLMSPERTATVSLENWREKIDVSVPQLKNIIGNTNSATREDDARVWLKNLTSINGMPVITNPDLATQMWITNANNGASSIMEVVGNDISWESLSVEGKKMTRNMSLECGDRRALVDQIVYMSLDELGYKVGDVVTSAAEIDALLPTALKGCGESVLWYAVGNDEIRSILARTDQAYKNTVFNDRSDISAYCDYLKSQMDSLSQMSGGDSNLIKEKQSVALYFKERIASANKIIEKIGRREVDIPNNIDEQFKIMREAVKVFETLSKAPGEGLEIMDQTVVYNAFILDATKGAESKVYPEVLQEMKARVKNLIIAKALKSAGGFMPSDRTGLDVVSVIERLRGSDDLFNHDDFDYFFRGDGNGLPIKDVWDLRQKWDFGTEYEEAIKGVVANYDFYKDEPEVEEMFERYGLENNAVNFQTMMYDGVAKINNNGVWEWSRPTKKIPFYADRGQVFSEDSNSLRKAVMKKSVEMNVAGIGGRQAVNNFNEAWGIVDLLRFSTAEDIRARINLEGHNTIWEGMSGLLNTLDRAGKLKTSANLYWVGQQIAQMGAPYLCYTMRHDIFTPLYSNEIDPRAFLEPKTDLSYWSSWVKTTQKASDYLTGGLDQKSLGSSIVALYDVIKKSIKAPTVIDFGVANGGFIDNMKRSGPNSFAIDTHGRRMIDEDMSKKIEQRTKSLFVRQAIYGLITLNHVTNGENIEEIAKTLWQLRKELTMFQYSDIEYTNVSPVSSEQPNYFEILNKVKEMTNSEKMKTESFMTADDFDKVAKEMGIEATIWKERGKNALTDLLKNLAGTMGK